MPEVASELARVEGINTGRPAENRHRAPNVKREFSGDLDDAEVMPDLLFS